MRSIFIIALLFNGVSIFGQTPGFFNYQAVARNISGAILPNQQIAARFTIHSGSANGNIVYQEIDTATTNQFGLFTAKIGGGEVQSGTFSTINWGSVGAYLEVEFDQGRTGTYTGLGTTQLLSVPYSLYSGQSQLASASAWIATAQAQSTTRNTWLDVAGNGLTVTAPSDGLYLINATGLMWGAGAGEDCLMRVETFGSNPNNLGTVRLSYNAGSSNYVGGGTGSFTGIYALKTGDQVKVQFQMEGNASNTFAYGGTGGNDGGSGITIVRIQ